MSAWGEGRRTIDYLLTAHKLETLETGDAHLSATGLVDRAALRLRTANAGLASGDPEGAFVAAYDAYRMTADSLLLLQGLRATGGQGSHTAVEDAVSAQFSRTVESFAKPTFERLRRTRNALQYFDPDAPEVDDDDARWAIQHAKLSVEGARDLITSRSIAIYRQD